MASSSGIIDTVSVEWLMDRMGSNRRWSSDSLSLVLDYSLLSKLINLWSSLPSSGPQLVIKHRLLLALLTIKTPFPEATLAAARSLVATALNDQTCDGQLIKLTCGIIMRYCPSLVPDTATAEAIQIGLSTTDHDSSHEKQQNSQTNNNSDSSLVSSSKPTQDDDTMMDHDTIDEDHGNASSVSLTKPNRASTYTIHDLIKEALILTNRYEHTITSYVNKSLFNHNHSSLSSSTLPNDTLSLMELPLQLRLLNPSVDLLKKYYIHVPPMIEPSLVSSSSSSSSASTTASTVPVPSSLGTSSASIMLAKIAAASAASQASLVPVTKQIKLSLNASKHITERSTLIQNCTLALSKLTIAQELTATVGTTTEETKEENGNTTNVPALTSAFDSTLHTMMQYLRGITPSTAIPLSSRTAMQSNKTASVMNGSSTTATTILTSSSTSTVAGSKKRERSEDDTDDTTMTNGITSSTKTDEGHENKRSTFDTDASSAAVTNPTSVAASTTTTLFPGETEQARIQREKVQKQINDSVLLTPDQRKLALAFTNKYNRPEHFPDKNIYQQYLQAKAALAENNTMMMDTTSSSSTSSSSSSPALTNLLRVSLPLEDTEVMQNNKPVKARMCIELNYETQKFRTYAKKL